MTDIRATDWEDLRAMDCSHHLAAARANAIVYEQSIKADTFIAQRVALIDADHGRRKSLYIFGRRKRGPGKGVASTKRLDSVCHRATIVVQVHQDAVIFGRGRILREGPLPGNIGA